MNGKTIWYRDFGHFIDPLELVRFVPIVGMPFTEQLNALFRFSLYFSIILFLVNGSSSAWYVAIFTGVFTAFMYEMYIGNRHKEQALLERLNIKKTRNDICLKPSKHNPFMNITMDQYTTQPTRPRACDNSAKQVKQDIEQKFENNLYRDVNDVFARNSSSRNWYTTPITTIPNDQTEFARALYGKKASCKDGNGTQCYSNLYRPHFLT